MDRKYYYIFTNNCGIIENSKLPNTEIIFIAIALHINGTPMIAQIDCLASEDRQNACKKFLMKRNPHVDIRYVEYLDLE